MVTLETTEFVEFLSHCNKMIENYSNHYKINWDNLIAKSGRRYIKVIQGTSVWAFIDKTNGDILKPASWRAPAKHARGNIFDGQFGVFNMTPHGPYSMR